MIQSWLKVSWKSIHFVIFVTMKTGVWSRAVWRLGGTHYSHHVVDDTAIQYSIGQGHVLDCYAEASKRNCSRSTPSTAPFRTYASSLSVLPYISLLLCGHYVHKMLVVIRTRWTSQPWTASSFFFYKSIQGKRHFGKRDSLENPQPHHPSEILPWPLSVIITKDFFFRIPRSSTAGILYRC